MESGIKVSKKFVIGVSRLAATLRNPAKHASRGPSRASTDLLGAVVPRRAEYCGASGSPGPPRGARVHACTVPTRVSIPVEFYYRYHGVLLHLPGYGSSFYYA